MIEDIVSEYRSLRTNLTAITLLDEPSRKQGDTCMLGFIYGLQDYMDKYKPELQDIQLYDNMAELFKHIPRDWTKKETLESFKIRYHMISGVLEDYRQ